MSPTVDLTREALTRVLVIEDSTPDALALDAALRDTFLATASIEYAATLEAGLERLGTDWFDGVLIDLGLPENESIEAFNRIWGIGGRAALVVLSGPGNDDLAAAVLERGAQDCLVKSTIRPGELGRAVESAISRQRVLHETERARDAQLGAKDQFLSRVSHELRSPLSVVHRFSSRLLDDVDGAASVDQQDFLSVMMRNVSQLQLMVDDLLQVTRTDSGRMVLDCRPLEIRELITQAVAIYQRSDERHHVTPSVLAGELPMVIADAERILEILANLLSNARKFTPDDGSITVDAVADAAFVRVTVRDTGCGIHPRDEDHIFEQFFQAENDGAESRDGLGLGLYICRDLIERQGGAIWAASSEGIGTAVSFTIPIDTSSMTTTR